MVFEQTLSGLIKALRANKRDEQKVINVALSEIRDEVRSKDWDVKAAAVLKLTYLEMLGHPTLVQHAFPVIECMAAPKFHVKQIGYLAASQSFAQSTEVILLANNLIRKDLASSSHPSTVILALCSLPALLTASPQLAEDLLPDLLRMLSHSRAQVRRIATLVIGKIWTAPRALPLEYSHAEKLRGGVNDEDHTVISATVNVMLELARSRPDARQSLLGLAPELFDLLTASTNNWMLIKIVKLFALLTPVEPRLVRKLLPPLTSLISTTPAFSLLYECIQTVIIGGMLSSPTVEAATLATTCIEKLSSFLSDSDQNLRYIALKGLSALLSTEHSHLLSAHYDEILSCIDEDDLTIRLKALELVERLTDRATCKEVVSRLLHQVAPSTIAADGRRTTEPSSRQAGGSRSAAAALRAVSSQYDKSSVSGLASTGEPTASGASNTAALASYKYRLLLLILRLTSRSSEDRSQLYVNISNFEWYIDTLVTVAYLALSVQPGGASSMEQPSALGSKIAECLLDVTARAPAVREATVKRMQRILGDDGFVDRSTAAALSSSSREDSAQPVLAAAAFIVSEYGTAVDGPEVAEGMLNRARHDTASIGHGQLLQGAMKMLAKWLQKIAEQWEESKMAIVEDALKSFGAHVQQIGNTEAAQYAQLVQLVHAGLNGPRLASVRGKAQQTEEAVAPAAVDEQNADNPDYNPFSNSISSAPARESVTNKDEADLTGPPAVLSILHGLFFAYELKPLAAGAQALVSPPEGLDLDAWIGEPLRADDPALASFLYADDAASTSQKGEVDEFGRPKARTVPVHSHSEEKLGSEKKSRKKSKRREVQDDDDVDSIPIVKLDLAEDGGQASSSSPSSTTASGVGLPPSSSSKRKSKATVSTSRMASPTARLRTPSPPPLILSAGGDMPTVSKRSAPPSPGVKPKAKVTSTETMPTFLSAHAGAQDPADRSLSEVVPEQGAVKVVKVKKKKASGSSALPVTAGEDGAAKAKKKKKKEKVAEET